MATKQSTIDFLIEQFSNNSHIITSKKMFGEYGLYVNNKVFAFVCDDQLFIKPIDEIKPHLKEITEAPAYPGSKMYYLISEDFWDDKEYLSKLAHVMEAKLPMPKPKKRKK